MRTYNLKDLTISEARKKLVVIYKNDKKPKKILLPKAYNFETEFEIEFNYLINL